MGNGFLSSYKNRLVKRTSTRSGTMQNKLLSIPYTHFTIETSRRERRLSGMRQRNSHGRLLWLWYQLRAVPWRWKEWSSDGGEDEQRPSDIEDIDSGSETDTDHPLLFFDIETTGLTSIVILSQAFYSNIMKKINKKMFGPTKFWSGESLCHASWKKGFPWWSERVYFLRCLWIQKYSKGNMNPLTL